MTNGQPARHQHFRSELVKGGSLLEDQGTDRRIMHYIVIGCIYLIRNVYEKGAVVANVMNHLVS